jgi:hypothetical protein
MILTLEQLPNDESVKYHSAGGASQLLLTRMEALHVNPDEVRRIESDVFTDLAEACANCDSKRRCEQDLASARTLGHDWESHCANAATLSALSELPWFGMALTQKR